MIAVFVRTFEAWDDALHSLQLDGLYVQFAYKTPIILCVVARSSPANLRWQLDTIYNQLISILSKFTLKQIYKERGDNFDLRRWLQDIDKRVDACVRSFTLDPVVYLSGFRILPLHASDREFVVNTLANCINAGTSTVC